MGLLFELFAHVKPYIVAYGAIVVFILIYIESFGAPVPGETAVITAGLLAAHGELHIVPLFIAVLLGSILGDSTGYLIGRTGGRALVRRFGSFVKLTPERYAMLEEKFRARGWPLVAVARFLPLMRQLNGLVAGTMEMPFGIFLPAQTVGAVLWTSLWTLGPYFFTEAFRAWHH
jgi:membrane protein DedA with SNARE-associated domain